ncbi:MAG TPA: multicopper oxidase domain-containing protein, partial [Thermoanaerobaculia bacterium]|nr:multicopper oxidase domain-containing protein [Thermoanaerobaculia bacterium]
NVSMALGMCERAYTDWAAGQDPTKWLQESAAVTLKVLLKAAQDAGNTQLVAQIQNGIDVNEVNRKNGVWPQYWPGVYPHYFDLPVWSGDLKQFPRMGQSPGTHWYHCHQHGSTTMQILNGMAGLIIVTGDYDKQMLAIGGGTPEKPKIKEQIMILQLFAEQPNQLNPNASVTTMAVNGQIQPSIAMKKNEVQWWRFADAAMRAHGIESYVWVNAEVWKNPGPLQNGVPPKATAPTPLLYQTAQDGVQFAWENYQRHSALTTFSLSPGNRADFLVQAPNAEGTFYLLFWPPAGKGPPPVSDIVAQTLLKVVVSGAAGSDVATTLPQSAAEFPTFPGFLADITDDEINGRHNTVTFSMTGGPGGPPNQPQFYIDGEQFKEGRIDQLMLLDTAEEWTLVNSSTGNIAHPFHIHINPFQITEVYNPQTMSAPEKQQAPYVWSDVIAIPAASGGRNGHIKIRSRFVDFPGIFVLHCHILGHEDRGMMQLVEVLDNKTVVKHH